MGKRNLTLLAAGAVFFAVAMMGGQALAQSSGTQAGRGQPTLLTPRVGAPGLPGGQGGVQQGSLPQQPEFTPEQKKYLLKMKAMKIEGGRAYVRQACNDPAWLSEYKERLDQFTVTERPDAITSFKEGWNESKARLGPEIVSCRDLLGG